MDCSKILIAFDGSENSYRAVSYVGEIVGRGSGFAITLLHVERLPDRDRFPDEAAWKERCKLQDEQVHEALEDAKAVLSAKGVPLDHIEERYLPSCHSPFHDRQVCSMGTSIAQDILRVQMEGDYGTIVVGRRGVSKQEEFLFGSISTKIIHHARTCSVWVVE